MEKIEDTLGEAVDLVFLAPDTEVKRGIFCSIEVTSIDMVHHGLMDRRIHNSFESLKRSEVLVSKLAEELYKHPTLMERALEITSSIKTKENLVEHENIVEPPTQVDISSTASKDDYTSRSESIHRQLERTHVVSAHRRKMGKL